MFSPQILFITSGISCFRNTRLTNPTLFFFLIKKTISTILHFSWVHRDIPLKFPHKCTWISTAAVVGAAPETNSLYCIGQGVKLNGTKTAAVRL